jgi:hypothetical protein
MFLPTNGRGSGEYNMYHELVDKGNGTFDFYSYSNIYFRGDGIFTAFLNNTSLPYTYFDWDNNAILMNETGASTTRLMHVLRSILL